MITAVPNVSEGRDGARIAAMVEACAPGRVLDVDPGHDAHRTVITLDGDLGSACFGLARRAVELLDLRNHHGIHPRMGAIDVIPIVANHEEVEQCREIAHALSVRIARELELPVFRYGIGARSLRSVRRFGFEGLHQLFADTAPDYGPARPHPSAGAVGIGVRRPMIAFNVCLESDDLALAQRIARAVRASAGGLPEVLAMGWRTPSFGCVQVSMNLTDWRRTPPHVVFDTIRHLAPVRGCELVGMIPEGAMHAAALHYRTDLEGVVETWKLGCVKPFVLAEKILEWRASA